MVFFQQVWVLVSDEASRPVATGPGCRGNTVDLRWVQSSLSPASGEREPKSNSIGGWVPEDRIGLAGCKRKPQLLLNGRKDA
jgi:hypothetical protein